MQALSNVISAIQICWDKYGRGRCKSCPYESFEDCDEEIIKDVKYYLQELLYMKEGLMNSTQGVPILPVGYINNEEIKEPKATLDQVISAFEVCQKTGSCEECPYHEDDICGDSFGNDARYYLSKYREMLNNGK